MQKVSFELSWKKRKSCVINTIINSYGEIVPRKLFIDESINHLSEDLMNRFTKKHFSLWKL